MTISSTTVKNSYAGNGTLDTFNYTFKIFADADIQVIIRDATATETVKTLTTHYTVTGAGSASGGTIVFTAGNIPTATETVVIRRASPQTQAIDYIANDPFPAESHEEGLDRSMMAIQQLQEEVDRSIKLSRTNTMNSTEFTIGDTDRANKVFGFDSAGELVVTQELGTFRGDWSASTAYEVRDIVKDTSTNNIFICLTAHTSSGSEPLTTNTDSAKWSLLVDAASATTSATAAAASATAASTSETNAATSATNAANSATAAATSETNASTSETNAASSATSAASSATSAASSASAAEATLDLFDDSYLGSKSSNPTLDNDGNALQDGALYFDTTNNVMKVYDLGSTTWFQLTPTVSNQTNINTVAAISADVTSVANIDTDVTAVANDATDIGTVATDLAGSDTIGTVAGISANVTTVAGISSAVSTVSGMSTAINTVNANETNINTVANNDANITTVANDTSDINTIITNLSNVNVVGQDLSNNFTHIIDNGSITDSVTDTPGTSKIDTVADDITNVNTVAGQITPTNNIATVAGADTNIGLVGGSIANVNTVASNITGVNSFAERYRVGSADPTTSLDEGDLAYNSTANALKYYDGTSWTSIAPGIANVSDDASPQLGGNLDTQSFTVDGRDVSVDGAKLDTIATSATANPNAIDNLVEDTTPQLGGTLDGQDNNLNNIGTIDGTNLQLDFGSI
jgi:hypothetical protein